MLVEKQRLTAALLILIIVIKRLRVSEFARALQIEIILLHLLIFQLKIAPIFVVLLV